MDLTVTTKGVDLSRVIQRDIERKTAKLNRLYGRLINLQLTFLKERQRTVCEIRLQIPRSTLIAEESADDAQTAFDQAMGKITRQLKRAKERRRHGSRRSPRPRPDGGEESVAEDFLPDMALQEAVEEVDEATGEELSPDDRRTDQLSVSLGGAHGAMGSDRRHEDQ